MEHQGSASQPRGDERRAFVRYACNLNTTCHPISLVKSDSWPTTVLDLSKTGIGLSVSRRFEPGVILNISLEAPDGSVERSLIVRVVNVAPSADGAWRLGCKLAGELGDEELRAFRAERLRPSEPDSRAWVRFTCDVETSCGPIGAAASESWTARIVDISPGGLSLTAPIPISTGTLLHVDLPATPEMAQRTAVIRVVHQQVLGPDLALLGCEFADLLPEGDLKRLH